MFGARVRDGEFYDAFRAHARVTVQAANLVSDLLSDGARVEERSTAVRQAEKEGDRIAVGVLRSLRETWITPLDRHVIHDLVIALEWVLDTVHATARSFSIFGLSDVRGGARELATLVVSATEQIERGMGLLGQAKKNEELLAVCKEIEAIEEKADDVHRHALLALFSGSPEPLVVYKWREIFDHLEEATDRCLDVGTILEGIVLDG